jgi:hypothetical protein
MGYGTLIARYPNQSSSPSPESVEGRVDVDQIR